MKKVILFGSLIFVFASLTVYGQFLKQYTAFEANYKIEIFIIRLFPLTIRHMLL